MTTPRFPVEERADRGVLVFSARDGAVAANVVAVAVFATGWCAGAGASSPARF